MALLNGDQSKSYLNQLVTLANNGFKAFAYQALTVTGATAQSLTIPVGTKYMECRLESSITASVPVRYLLLGGATLPTTTTGMAINHLDVFDVTDAQNVNNFRIIEATAGTHVLHVQYYK